MEGQMIKKIKFSHDYYKFMGMVSREYPRAKLLQAIKINCAQLSTDFIRYDTLYGNPNDLKYYELPKTDLILLLFLSEHTNQLFTTIRRFMPKKWDYYIKSEGEWFEIICPSTTPSKDG